jgi:citrate lyase gamma subunit
VFARDVLVQLYNTPDDPYRLWLRHRTPVALVRPDCAVFTILYCVRSFYHHSNSHLFGIAKKVPSSPASNVIRWTDIQRLMKITSVCILTSQGTHTHIQPASRQSMDLQSNSAVEGQRGNTCQIYVTSQLEAEESGYQSTRDHKHACACACPLSLCNCDVPIRNFVQKLAAHLEPCSSTPVYSSDSLTHVAFLTCVVALRPKSRVSNVQIYEKDARTEHTAILSSTNSSCDVHILFLWRTKLQSCNYGR